MTEMTFSPDFPSYLMLVCGGGGFVIGWLMWSAGKKPGVPVLRGDVPDELREKWGNFFRVFGRTIMIFCSISFVIGIVWIFVRKYL